MVVLKRFSTIKPKVNRETVFKKDLGRNFDREIREFCNGMINSHGGVIYYGVEKNGCVVGLPISRREEDSYRLSIDRMFGSFQPFVSAEGYRLNFIEVSDAPSNYVVIEVKVSCGEVGEIYEDGHEKVFLIDNSTLIGPLYPQELKELILLKYKESLEGAEEAQKYVTPYLATAKKKARRLSVAVQKKPLSPVTEEEENVYRNGKLTTTSLLGKTSTLPSRKRPLLDQSNLTGVTRSKTFASSRGSPYSKSQKLSTSSVYNPVSYLNKEKRYCRVTSYRYPSYNSAVYDYEDYETFF